MLLNLVFRPCSLVFPENVSVLSLTKRYYEITFWDFFFFFLIQTVRVRAQILTAIFLVFHNNTASKNGLHPLFCSPRRNSLSYPTHSMPGPSPGHVLCGMSLKPSLRCVGSQPSSTHTQLLLLSFSLCANRFCTLALTKK